MEKLKVKISDLKKTKEFIVSKGENLIVSDPCYELSYIDKGEDLNHRFKAKAGIWAYYFDEDTRTLDVYEINSSYLVKRDGINTRLFDEIKYMGVDSGQVGVFLEKSFRNKSLVEDIEFENEIYNTLSEPWYRACCEITTSSKCVGFVPFGFVSRTRYGDGCYPVGIKYDPGTDEVAYIRIVTEDICEHCGVPESMCECESCYECGNKEYECSCECCDRCGNKISECYCEDDEE